MKYQIDYMKNKITLITPPDIYENNSRSFLFINPIEQDQEKITNYLSTSNEEENINIYFYSGEEEVTWLLYATSVAGSSFIDLDNHSNLTEVMAGYIISKPNVYYKTHNTSIAAVYQHINSNRVPDIDFFLENIVGQNK